MKKAKEHFKDHPNHVGCDYGIRTFNTNKRSSQFVEEINENQRRGGRKPPKGGGGGTGTGGVILLDFDGHTVTGTSWNYSGDIVCAPSGLTWEEQQLVIDNMMQDYAIFNVVITTDEAVYNAAPQNRRIRCVLTETWEWYGQAGGVAFVGSFSWYSEDPCFVFTSLLGYNNKYIREAASHEVGHTMGLYHQSTYDVNCVMISQYNYGGNGEAPIMGVGYYQPDVHWWVGPNSLGCNSIQDDSAILTTTLGLK